MEQPESASGLKVNLGQDKTFIGIDYPLFINKGISCLFLGRRLQAGFEDRVVSRQSTRLTQVAALTARALTWDGVGRHKAKMGMIP